MEEDALGELTELGEFDEFDDLGELDELDAATDLIITAPPSTPMRSAQSLQAAQPPPRRISPWDNWREQAAHTEQGEHVEPEGRAGSAQTTRKEEDGHV